MKPTKAEIRRLASQYPKWVEWSDDDNAYVGACPTLFAGGVHGKSEAGVYEELCRVAEDWVRLLLSDGIDLPATGLPGKLSGKFVVRIDPSLHKRLALKAHARGESLNSLATRALLRA